MLIAVAAGMIALLILASLSTPSIVKAEAPEPGVPLVMRRVPVLSVTASLLSGIPDLAGLSAVVHAIPYFDIEAGGSYFALGWAATIRGCPRFTIIDATRRYGEGVRAPRQSAGWRAVVWIHTEWNHVRTAISRAKPIKDPRSLRPVAIAPLASAATATER